MKRLPVLLAALAGVLLILGLVLGLMPHSASVADAYGAKSVECGSAFGGDYEARNLEDVAAIAGTYVGGARYTPGVILNACESARMSWLPWSLIIVGAALLLTAAVLAFVRMGNVTPRPA